MMASRTAWFRRCSPQHLVDDYNISVGTEDEDEEDEGMGLDNVRHLTCDLNTPRIDSYRFSMANLEDSQDVDLDAILGELCALETQCEQSINEHVLEQENKRRSHCVQQQNMQQHRRTHSRSSSEGNRYKLDPGDTELSKGDSVIRTDSPDNDSAFSDNVSMLSSESSASSGGSGSRTDTSKSSSGLGLAPSPTQMDQASRIKAEKIRIALEKMKEANVKKLFIKAFTADGSTKSLLVDEKMSCAYVTRLLADKNHVHMDSKWAVVEHLPDLHMERVYEDHELLVENLMMWTRDSKNKLLFLERPDRTQLFSTPENFLLGQTDKITEYDDHARTVLLEEFFSSTNVGIPEVEGPLYLKADSKKGWKKHHFVLRASGLYYWPKEKVKSSRDLVCLATFDVNQVYYGLGWKKKYKAPTDFCFGIKHPRLQQPKSSKYIKYLCAEDESTLHRWIVGIRIAKYGSQIMDNYRCLVDDLAQDDLDLLAHARSCSVSSISTPSQATTPGSEDSDDQNGANVTPTYINHLNSDGLPGPGSRLRRQESSRSRASSSSSSGCLSDGAPSSCEVGFECDFPSGTIKRKPSMNPKLPLTSITRQLKEVGETADRCQSPSSGSSGGGTLTRNGVTRQSRRKSCATPEDTGSNSSTLKRHHSHKRGSLDTPRNMSSSSSNASTPVREKPEDTIVTSPIRTSTKAELPPPILQLPPETIPKEDNDMDNLPPPPPEMFESTLSLDSLPPPPLPSELPVYQDLGGSSLSLMSLPPPPSPCVDDGTIQRRPQKLPTPYSSSSSTPTNTLSPASTPTRTRTCFSPPQSPRSTIPHHTLNKTVANAHKQALYSQQQPYENNCQTTPSPSSNYSAPPYLAELKAGSPMLTRKPSFTESSIPSSLRNSLTTTLPPSQPAASPKSPILSTKQRTRTAPKKISFNFTPEEIGSPVLPSSPTYASRSLSFNNNKKPLPPKRSESTRLSNSSMSPKRLSDADSALTPPKEFLKDLQRIMKKKWQVAQKCKQDSSTTPHEVLGFRDPPPPVADYRETNVSNWVREHYGYRDNLYENVYTVNDGHKIAETAVPEVVYSSGSSIRNQGGSVDYYISSATRQANIAMAIASKKRPPPPPPKRSETTQLTTRLH